MIYIIATIACIILGCIIGIYEEGDLAGVLLGMVSGVLIGTIVSFFILITTAICVNNNVEYIDEGYSCNIVALKDERIEEGELNGSFFLGCGSISSQNDSKMVYSYLKDTKDGFIMCHTYCDQAYIKTTNGQPRVEVTNKYAICKVSNEVKKWFWLGENKMRIETFTTFYIPENSICYDYNIDME